MIFFNGYDLRNFSVSYFWEPKLYEDDESSSNYFFLSFISNAIFLKQKNKIKFIIKEMINNNMREAAKPKNETSPKFINNILLIGWKMHPHKKGSNVVEIKGLLATQSNKNKK